jgi:hypothetical protein
LACRFHFLRHIVAHVSSNVSYLRGNPFIFIVYQFSAPSPPSLLLLPRTHALASGASLSGLEICKIKDLDKWKHG